MESSNLRRKRQVNEILYRIQRKSRQQLHQQTIQGFFFEQQLKKSLESISKTQQKMASQIKAKKRTQQRTSERRQLITFNKINLYKSKGRNHLPQLKQLIGNRQSTEINRQKRNHLIDLLILAIMRRKYGKTYEALDLLFKVAGYFKKKKRSETTLKTITYSLIAKMYKQILRKKQYSNSVKRNSHRGRHTSLMIKTLTCQDIFFQRFSNSLQKSKLLMMSSYSQIVNNKNQIRNELHQKHQILVPEPQILFNRNDKNDYKLLLIFLDEKTALFPYKYSNNIKEILSKQDLFHMIAKVNQHLLPQRKCFDFQSTLRNLYQPLTLMCFFIFVILLLLLIIKNYTWRPAAYAFILFIIPLIISIVKKQADFKGLSESYDQISLILLKQEEKYSQHKLKFRIAQNLSVIFIIFQELKGMDSGVSFSATSLMDMPKPSFNCLEQEGTGSNSSISSASKNMPSLNQRLLNSLQALQQIKQTNEQWKDEIKDNHLQMNEEQSEQDDEIMDDNNQAKKQKQFPYSLWMLNLQQENENNENC